ncbi:MAG: hypothetical protein U0354_07225 [Candidatus Sericytochromatia bacterium]
MSYINPMLSGNLALGGIQMSLAAAYESRIHTFSRMTVARAQFAGDTAVTLTDGSYNTRFIGGVPNNDIPKSATAQLANTSNTAGQWGKPLVIKPLRDPFTAEIYDYAVFNADGTHPGAAAGNPYDPTYRPIFWNGATNRWEIDTAASRYLVNKQTGEIYVNKVTGLIEHQNPDGLVDVDGSGTQTAIINNNLGFIGNANPVATRKDNVVGIVDFEGLQGGALSNAQQQASELSGVISSLTSILRSANENKKTTLGLIR